MTPLGRQDFWLPVLRRLTEELPEWCIWKGTHRLFTEGDVDSAVPRRLWTRATSAFARHAGSLLGPIAVCDHFPDVRLLVTGVVAGRPFVELDFCDRQLFRGATLFSADELVPLHVMDTMGYRRLRNGAEGVILLLLKGMTLTGAPRPDDITKSHVAELLADEPGADLAATVLGLPRSPLNNLARAVRDGTWDRNAAVVLQASFSSRSFREAPRMISRLVFRAGGIDRCVVTKAIFSDSRFVADPTEWWRSVRESHVVVEPSSNGGR